MQCIPTLGHNQTKKNKEKNIKIKTMKKIILTTAILFAAVAGVFAQESKLTGDVELSVTIMPIQILTINGATVNLKYETKDNYDKGVEVPKDNHLNVYSTGAFNVTVKSLSDNLKNTMDENQTIDSEGIKITATTSLDNDLNYTLLGKDVSLGSEKSIIMSTEGGVDKNFNITYKGEGGNAYISKYFKDNNGAESVYTTTVTYTIAAN